LTEISGQLEHLIMVMVISITSMEAGKKEFVETLLELLLAQLGLGLLTEEEKSIKDLKING